MGREGLLAFLEEGVDGADAPKPQSTGRLRIQISQLTLLQTLTPASSLSTNTRSKLLQRHVQRSATPTAKCLHGLHQWEATCQWGVHSEGSLSRCIRLSVQAVAFPVWVDACQARQ